MANLHEKNKRRKATPPTALQESKEISEKKQADVEACDESSDMFSDVFQGDVVDVTKNVVLDRLSLDKSGSIAIPDDLVQEELKADAVQRSFDQQIGAATASSAESFETANDKDQDIIRSPTSGSYATANDKVDQCNLSFEEKRTYFEGMSDVEDSNTAPNIVNGEESHASTVVDTTEEEATSSPTAGAIARHTSEKRRERRKLRRGGDKHAKESTDTATVDDDDNSITTSNSKETLGDSSTATSPEKRRVWQQMRRGQQHNASAEMNASTEMISLPVMSADDNVHNATNNSSNEAVGTPAATTLDSQKRRERRKIRQSEQHQNENGSSSSSPDKSRRQKIAERVAKGKVPIPNALLQPKKPNSIYGNNVDALSSDVAVAGGISSPPKTPIDKSNELLPPFQAGVETPMTPKTPMASTNNTPSSPTSQRLIVTPTNEVEMKLVEADDENAQRREQGK